MSKDKKVETERVSVTLTIQKEFDLPVPEESDAYQEALDKIVGEFEDAGWSVNVTSEESLEDPDVDEALDPEEDGEE